MSVEYHGPKEQLEAALGLGTAPGELAELGKRVYGLVRAAVAANPRTYTMGGGQFSVWKRFRPGNPGGSGICLAGGRAWDHVYFMSPNNRIKR